VVDDVKALTLTQPWATLVALGAKRIETRSWPTAYRGPLAIHAAKGFPPSARDLCRKAPFDRPLWDHGIRLWPDLPLGVVIATCGLVDVLPIVAKPVKGQHCVAPDDEGLMRVWHPTEVSGVHGHHSDTTTEHEHEFGDYTPGRWAWVLADIERLKEPVPAHGALGLWEWTT
jgi:activating signal cointegrator 1